MINVNLLINDGSYCNDTAIENTINYTFKLEQNPQFYYGIWPPTKETAIATFEGLRQTYPGQTCSKQVQHFILSFSNLKDVQYICSFAEQVAFLFAPLYPICFALHDDTKHLHVHFIVSTTSHLPNQAPLEAKLWRFYIKAIKDFAIHNNISLLEVHKNVGTI